MESLCTHSLAKPSAEPKRKRYSRMKQEKALPSRDGRASMGPCCILSTNQLHWLNSPPPIGDETAPSNVTIFKQKRRAFLSGKIASSILKFSMARNTIGCNYQRRLSKYCRCQMERDFPRSNHRSWVLGSNPREGSIPVWFGEERGGLKKWW